MKKKDKNNKNQTVNDYINVADIRANVLYTKDNHIISFIKIEPVSISTMSRTDVRLLTRTLSSEFSSLKTNLRLFKISKPIDISGLVNSYREMYKTSNDLNQKELLRESAFFLHKHAINGSQLENEHYVIVRKKLNGNNLDELEKEALSIVRKFSIAKIGAKICDTEEIARLCNLFVNPSYSNIESMELDESISIINDVINN